jgi:hypothetical protein
LDNIAVSNAQELNNPVINNVAAGRSLMFAPATMTNYLLMVRAQINSRTLPWGPVFAVSATGAASPAEIQPATVSTISGNQVQIDFTVTNFRPGIVFELQKTADLDGTWTQDTSAVPETLIADSKFRFTSSMGTATRLFFRVKAH